MTLKLYRPANKFKPNTRFLRNIIKGTDRHNKALLAKEQSEAQARLKSLANAEEEKRRKYRPTADEMRGRQLGNIAAMLTGQSGGQKRKRPAPADDEDGEASEMQKARAAEDARRLEDMAAARKRQREKEGKRKRSLERYTVRRSKKRKDDDGESYARRNSSSEDEEREEDDRKRRRKDRSRSPKSSPRKHRHRSPMRSKDKDKDKDKSTSAKAADRSPRKSANRSSNTQQMDGDADSDPLEDLMGPAPPPKVVPRGRGALNGASDMDSRFSDYDPKSDVQLDDDTRDDWDDALEALRDRARFRQQGADRLRQAGFTEEQVKKWEKGGEKNIDDVQWTKAGEKREWDRGKDVEQEDDD